MKHKIGFIGMGLIGGSIARAIRQYFPDYEIVAFDKNKETLALATQESVIDVAATTIDGNFHHCSYLFLCAPVSYNTAYLKQVKDYLHKDCILTDVGSVKTNIHQEVEALGIEESFIGGHPMAGSAERLATEEELRHRPDQLTLFGDEDDIPAEELERERTLQETMLGIKEKFGKNAVLKATSLKEGATARQRNKQIGGHSA